MLLRILPGPARKSGVKMDKEEVKREMKEQEGNPEVKSKRRKFMENSPEQVKSGY